MATSCRSATANGISLLRPTDRRRGAHGRQPSRASRIGRLKKSWPPICAVRSKTVAQCGGAWFRLRNTAGARKWVAPKVGSSWSVLCARFQASRAATAAAPASKKALSRFSSWALTLVPAAIRRCAASTSLRWVASISARSLAVSGAEGDWDARARHWTGRAAVGDSADQNHNSVGRIDPSKAFFDIDRKRGRVIEAGVDDITRKHEETLHADFGQ